MKDIGINSEKEAMDFWVNGFGEPVGYKSFDDLVDCEAKLTTLRAENDELNREIKTRDVTRMNEYKIDRSIELHFLITVGEKYLEEASIQVGLHEEEIEETHGKFSRVYSDSYDPWKEDGLFPEKYDDTI